MSTADDWNAELRQENSYTLWVNGVELKHFERKDSWCGMTRYVRTEHIMLGTDQQEVIWNDDSGGIVKMSASIAHSVEREKMFSNETKEGVTT